MKIYIFLMTRSVEGKLFKLNGVNPGCGGTEYVSVLLGINLAKTMSMHHVYLVNNENFQIENCPENLKIELIDNVETFFEEEKFQSNTALYILPASILKKIDAGKIINVKNKIVCWMHHPFDYSHKLKKLDFYAYVCTGNYQWHSNKLFYKKIWCIQAHFIRPKNFSKEKNELKQMWTNRFEDLKIVHLGTLLPSKGFLYIAKSWNSIKKAYPGISLHVVGGISTYGINEAHKLIPTTKEFGEEILKHIPLQDILDKKVVFHGNLGREKNEIIENSVVAIQNPTGKTEAFPESPLECMAFGVPVIASDDYGMGDMMRFFPEMALKDPFNIVQKLELILKNIEQYQELSLRGLLIAEYFEKNKDEIDLRWKRLLNGYEQRSSLKLRDIGCEPSAMFYGDPLILKWRSVVNKVKSIARSAFIDD